MFNQNLISESACIDEKSYRITEQRKTHQKEAIFERETYKNCLEKMPIHRKRDCKIFVIFPCTHEIHLHILVHRLTKNQSNNNKIRKNETERKQKSRNVFKNQSLLVSEREKKTMSALKRRRSEKRRRKRGGGRRRRRRRRGGGGRR